MPELSCALPVIQLIANDSPSKLSLNSEIFDVLYNCGNPPRFRQFADLAETTILPADIPYVEYPSPPIIYAYEYTRTYGMSDVVKQYLSVSSAVARSRTILSVPTSCNGHSKLIRGVFSRFSDNKIKYFPLFCDGVKSSNRQRAQIVVAVGWPRCSMSQAGTESE